MKLFKPRRSTHARIWLFCDGGAGGLFTASSDEAPPATKNSLVLQAGCGAVARSDEGEILEWAWRALPAMTNNEAEYAGLILGLELARRLRAEETVCVLDSATVVWQMEGRSRVNSATLRPWHRQACAAINRLPAVHFRLAPRELNCLADALARQARFPWAEIKRVLEEGNF
jgi:ribonuclease HI